MENKVETNESVMEFYFKNPAYLISKAKSKTNRFKSNKRFKPYDAYYISELEKSIINDTKFDMKIKRKYLKEIYNYAMKNKSYLFESDIFSEENIKKFYNTAERLEIVKQKKHILEDLHNKIEFTDDDFNILNSIIESNIFDEKLFCLYRRLLISEKITSAEAEFIVNYTMHLLNKKYTAFITNYNFYDEKINTNTNIEFDGEEPVLEFNANKISKTDNNNLSFPFKLVYETIKQIESLKYYEQVKSGELNIYSFEVALESIFAKHLNRRTLNKKIYSKKQIHLNTKSQFIDFLNKLGFKDILSNAPAYVSNVCSITEKEIGYLDEIMENFPEELENYKIFKYFYNEDGTRKTYAEIMENLKDNNDFTYIIRAFMHQKLQSKFKKLIYRN